MIKLIIDTIKSLLSSSNSDILNRKSSPNIKIGGNVERSKIGNNENCGNTLTNNANNSGVVGHINDSVINVYNPVKEKISNAKELNKSLARKLQNSIDTFSDLKHYERWIKTLKKDSQFSEFINKQFPTIKEKEKCYQYLLGFIYNGLIKSIEKEVIDFSDDVILFHKQVIQNLKDENLHIEWQKMQNFMIKAFDYLRNERIIYVLSLLPEEKEILESYLIKLYDNFHI